MGEERIYGRRADQTTVLVTRATLKKARIHAAHNDMKVWQVIDAAINEYTAL